MRQAGGAYVWVDPTDCRSELRGFRATSRGGLNRGPAMAHSLGRVSPVRRWRSSEVEALARRTRVACSGIGHGVGVPALLAVSPC